MELSIESPCQHVSWKVRDFFQLPPEIGYYIDSPEIRFADDSYCMRLYPNGARRYRDAAATDVYLVRLTSTVRERKVSCKFGYTMGNRKGHEFDVYDYSATSFKELGYSFRRSYLEEKRDTCVPDGIFSVLCSMSMGKLISVGSPQFEESNISNSEDEQKVLTGQSLFFSCCWRSSKMELSIESPYQYVVWKVPDFFQLPSDIGYSLHSPEFGFSGDSYCLRLYPNGETIGDKRHPFVKVLRLTFTVPERYASCKVGYRWINGKGNEFDTYHCPGILTEEFRVCISRSLLEKSRDKYVPDGIFSMLCSMRLIEQSGAKSLQSEEDKNSDAQEKQERLPGIAKLQSDYRRLLKKGAESDACVVVSGQKFRVHKNILRARSVVFDAMFTYKMAEKESGRVVINDLDPESFGEFLEYLYTGSIGAGLSDDNAFGLYTAADKYDVPTLKSECVAHISRNLSVDTFCDVMTLALRHREEDLLQQAIHFFKVNLQRIIVTVKWQQFLSENCTSANELFIKAVVPGGQ